MKFIVVVLFYLKSPYENVSYASAISRFVIVNGKEQMYINEKELTRIRILPDENSASGSWRSEMNKHCFERMEKKRDVL